MRTGSYEVTKVFKVNCRPLEKERFKQAILRFIQLYIYTRKNSGPTSQITACSSIIQTDVHMLFRDIIAVCSDQNIEHLNRACEQNKQDRA
jgi:hypothetical protein